MPRYNNPKKTRRYSEDFKGEAVRMSQEAGVLVKDVAESLDMHPFMLSRWRKEAAEEAYQVRTPKSEPARKEDSESRRIRELQKENTRLRTENEILKVATVSGGTKAQKWTPKTGQRFK